MSTASSIGLSSGINYSDLLTKLRQVNSRPISLIQSQENKINTQRQSLAKISQAISNFQAKATSLSTSDAFMNMMASADDSSVLTASATNSAVSGQYSVKVRQLAQNHRIASQGVDNMDSTAIATGAGKFEYKVGDGATVSVSVNAGMTMQQLRDAINSADGKKVSASIVNDGTASNPYRLVLSAADTGLTNAISIVTNDTTLNLTSKSIEAAVAKTGNAFNGTIAASGAYTGSTGKNIVMEVTSAGALGAAKYKVSYDGGVTWTANDAFTTSTSDVDVTGASAEGVNVRFSADAAPVNFAVGDRFSIDTFVPELQKAQNGLIEVNSVQISRASNTFSDVIDGLTLTAKKVSDTSQTVKVQNSSGSVSSKISEFVSAYNSLVDTAAKETAYNTETQTGAALFGDSGVTGILAQVRANVSGNVFGLSTTNTLSSIGVSMDKAGHLSVDSTKLSAALTSNADAGQETFHRSRHQLQFLGPVRQVHPGYQDREIHGRYHHGG